MAYLDKIKVNNTNVDVHDSRISNEPVTSVNGKTGDVTLTVPATYAASTTAGGAALKTGSIPFGVVDSTSTATAFTATVDGITELTDGTCVLLKNSVVTSAAGFTININNLGAYPAFNNLSAAKAETTIFNINYTMLFVFDSTRVVGESTGAWCCYRGYDSNTNTIGYQLRTNSSTMPASDKGYRYRLWFTSADGTKYVPANKSTSTNATTARTMNTTPIDPFGRIIYYSTNGTTSAGTNLAAGTCWELYAVTIGYSYVLSMTPYKPVYVQCTPQADGSAVMNTLTQTLPSTEDGKIYIFLGIAYSATAMELVIEHPVYYYKNGAIRLWTNAEEVTLPTPSTETIVTVSYYDGDRHYITKEDADKLKELHTVVKLITSGEHSATFLWYGYPDGNFVYQGISYGGTMTDKIKYVKNTDTFTILGLAFTYDPDTTYYISEVSSN